MTRQIPREAHASVLPPPASQRFLIREPASATKAIVEPLRVILDWPAALDK
jgi:hypothetical protein